jgi:DNA-binding NtrC family response regulator
LRNVIERAVIICSGEVIERHHLAPYPLEQRARSRGEDTLTLPVGTPIEEVERRMILRTLQKTENNKTRAAELLQISLKTLHNKLRHYREHGLLPASNDTAQRTTGHQPSGEEEDMLSAGQP